MKLFVEAVGLAGPGLPGWQEAQPVLTGAQPYVAQDLAPYSPELLPPNERRRATPCVRLAFRTAENALSATPLKAAELATVFASADGDLDVVHRINSALAQPARTVSPTDFHNSVHNAPAGYWSIAVGARRPSTSLAAHDASFGAGLLEAAALVAGDELDTLYACYDVRAPAPLSAQRAVPVPFGVALVLTAQKTERSLAALDCGMSGEADTTMDDAALEGLRKSNAAARALPLLRLLARRESGTVVVPGVSGAVRLSLSAG